LGDFPEKKDKSPNACCLAMSKSPVKGGQKTGNGDLSASKSLKHSQEDEGLSRGYQATILNKMCWGSQKRKLSLRGGIKKKGEP